MADKTPLAARPCKKCGVIFYTAYDAKRHWATIHGPRHEIKPVYMASGYQWCNNCGVNLQRWGEGWRHRAGYEPPFRR